MRSLLLAIICFFTYKTNAASTDTISLYFELGKSNLTPVSERTLDSFLYHDIINNTQLISIFGYGDFVGSEEINLEISKSRANNVQAYLERYGISKENIKLIVGKGKITRTAAIGTTSYPADRKVDIVLSAKQATNANSPFKISNLKKNDIIRLPQIRFEPATPKFKPEAFETLKLLLQFLQSYPRLKIGIEGHVCCPVSKSKDVIIPWEQKLSISRAKAVFDYLVKNGIDTSRLRYKGFGATKLFIEPENTPEDAWQNMRVEIRVLDK